MEILLSAIAEAVDGRIEGDPDVTISGAAPFDEAAEGDITFAAGKKYLSRIKDTRAGAVIVPDGAVIVPDGAGIVPDRAGIVPQDVAGAPTNLVVVSNPEVAFARALALLYPPVRQEKGVHPTACIGENVSWGEEISIGPCAVVSDHVTLGDRVTLHPGVVIGQGVSIGDDVEIHPNVTIFHDCRIGSRVAIQSGSVIGSDGFGYKPDGEAFVQTPHIGIVRIDDDVEIGASNTIDRGTLGQTWIKRGVKTDNQVHIAHNVTIGENTLLIAQVGIAGSATIGRQALLAGQAGVGGHLTVGNYTIVGPQAGVARSIGDGQIVSGTPEMPHKVWLRAQRTIPQLPELRKKILKLEKQLDRLLDKEK